MDDDHRFFSKESLIDFAINAAMLLLVVAFCGGVVFLAAHFDHGAPVEIVGSEPTKHLGATADFSWRETAKETVSKLIPEIVVAVLSALAAFLFARRKYKQKYDAAAKRFTKRIGDQIARAPLSDHDVEVQARSIVAIRDDLKTTLIALNKLLNSDIDVLKSLVESYRADPSGRTLAEMRTVVDVLKQKWPSKSDQIEIEVRKLYAELGLEPE